jgi:hypothetical protein
VNIVSDRESSGVAGGCLPGRPLLVLDQSGRMCYLQVTVSKKKKTSRQ